MPIDPDNQRDTLMRIFPKDDPRVELGPGEDDCGVAHTASSKLVVSTDFLNASPIALELGIGSHYDLGFLVVTASAADVFSTGADPQLLLINVRLPSSDSQTQYESLLQGVAHACRKYGIAVIGGDTKLGEDLALSSVCIGSLSEGQEVVSMGGAKVGDGIFVSGHLGAVAAAIELISSERNHGQDFRHWATKQILEPYISISAVSYVREHQLANSGTDISDGLLSDLHSLCAASKVGATISMASLPIASETRAISQLVGIANPTLLALTIGGESRILITSSAENQQQLTSNGWVRIGTIDEHTGVRLSGNRGTITDAPRLGHSDFRSLSFRAELTSLLSQAELLE